MNFQKHRRRGRARIGIQVGATLAVGLASGCGGNTSGGNISDETDLFVFAGASATLYRLSYPPVSSSVVASLNGVFLAQGAWNGSSVVGGQWALNPADQEELELSPTLSAPSKSTLVVKYQRGGV